jgi:hypothetical protein
MQHCSTVDLFVYCDRVTRKGKNNLNASCSLSPDVVKRSHDKQKPVCVIHYNQNMGGVDKKYQLLQI